MALIMAVTTQDQIQDQDQTHQFQMASTHITLMKIHQLMKPQFIAREVFSNSIALSWKSSKNQNNQKNPHFSCRIESKVMIQWASIQKMWLRLVELTTTSYKKFIILLDKLATNALFFHYLIT
jgi:hypothetical protein